MFGKHKRCSLWVSLRVLVRRVNYWKKALMNYSPVDFFFFFFPVLLIVGQAASTSSPPSGECHRMWWSPIAMLCSACRLDLLFVVLLALTRAEGVLQAK